jgi:hypothetical protein
VLSPAELSLTSGMQNPARFGTEFGKIRGTGGLVLCVKGSAGNPVGFSNYKTTRRPVYGETEVDR